MNKQQWNLQDLYKFSICPNPLFGGRLTEISQRRTVPALSTLPLRTPLSQAKATK